jgi:hypothetical protein
MKEHLGSGKNSEGPSYAHAVPLCTSPDVGGKFDSLDHLDAIQKRASLSIPPDKDVEAALQALIRSACAHTSILPTFCCHFLPVLHVSPYTHLQ